MIRRVLISSVLLFFGLVSYTQGPAFRTIDETIAVLYSSISGPAGQARDEELFKSLFVEGAQLRAQYEDSLGNRKIALRTVDSFWSGLSKFTATHAFFEKETARRTEHWDGMAHVWSSYQAFDGEDSQQPFAEGINSIQLFFDGSRWWVVSIYWQPVFGEGNLPKTYRKGIR